MNELVLIADDDRDFVGALEFSFEREGFRTRSALSSWDALEKVTQPPVPDLVLVSLEIPGESGIEVCRRLRDDAASKAVPVIMLVAKTEEVYRVMAYEAGADDCVTKPVSVRELLLRAQAVLRRTNPEARENRRLVQGCLTLDVAGHRAWVDQREISLTALEFRLLSTLASHGAHVHTRDRLLDVVWDTTTESTTRRTVDTHVRRLRQKLGRAASCIETVRGVGYRFRAPADLAGHDLGCSQEDRRTP